MFWHEHSAYAKKIEVSYQAAWNHCRAGLIPNAKKLPSGIIVINEKKTISLSARQFMRAFHPQKIKPILFHNPNECRIFALQKVGLFRLWLKNVAVD